MARSASARVNVGRFVVVLCVAALLVGDVFRGLHLLTARHVVCAEHGELVHEDEASAPSRTDGEAAHARIATGGSASHHHDHCELAAFRPKSAQATIAAAPGIFEIAPATELLPFTEAVAPRARSVLSYAPKQSPPS